MSNRPMLRKFILASSFATFAFAGAFLGASDAQAGDEESPACTAKSFKVDAVKKACAKGGQKEAKKVMKKAIANAKAKEEKINCKTCHSDLKTFAQKPNAVADLQKWLKG